MFAYLLAGISSRGALVLTVRGCVCVVGASARLLGGGVGRHLAGFMCPLMQCAASCNLATAKAARCVFLLLANASII